jgi:putative oxygen-independent coproporphyrinogen III oxidase
VRATPINLEFEARNPNLSVSPPLTLYVHIPWCVRKCPYCDFNSHQAADGGVPERDYVSALLKDLELSLPLVWGRKVHTVFFGGGTPSLLSARAVDEILTGVRTLLPLDPLAEVTLEANPGTFEAQKFADFRAAGVNRLSIGIQSFNPRHLQALGRIHDDREARQAVEIAQRHFDNFNLDLMYGLPEQTLEQAVADIRAAIACAPRHISAYHLTVEPNTWFYRHPPQLPDDDLCAAMQAAIEEELGQVEYEHYETSAFARKGSQCRHNLNYWLFGDYLGIGAGAHSKLSLHDRVLRQARHRQPRAYVEQTLAGSPIQSEHALTAGDRGFEFMMNALRLTAGFPVALFHERTGLPITAVEGSLRQAEQRGLITRDHLQIRPTELGRRFLNELLQLFLPDEEET